MSMGLLCHIWYTQQNQPVFKLTGENTAVCSNLCSVNAEEKLWQLCQTFLYVDCDKWLFSETMFLFNIHYLNDQIICLGLS